MGYICWILVTFKFTEKFLFGEKCAVWAQLRPRFCNLICRDLIPGFFEKFYHESAQ